ncbi:hypothetical protein [Metabacillus fastidiosus]
MFNRTGQTMDFTKQNDSHVSYEELNVKSETKNKLVTYKIGD